MILAKTVVKTEIVPLKDIIVDQGINPRAEGTSEETAQEYAAALEAGDEFPPAVVYRDRQGTLRLSEGFTRHRAYEIRGSFGMPCIVRAGDRRDAAINAAASNQSHGQRRTNADKRRAVEILLAVCKDWSNRRIAGQTGVSDMLVADVRVTVPDSCTAYRVGSDGVSQPVVKTMAHTGGGPAISSPSKIGDIPAPNPRADFDADVIVVCLKLAECRAEVERCCAEVDRLAFTAYGETIGHKKALAALRAAVTSLGTASGSLWADRPGKPPV